MRSQLEEQRKNIALQGQAIIKVAAQYFNTKRWGDLVKILTDVMVLETQHDVLSNVINSLPPEPTPPTELKAVPPEAKEEAISA